MSPWVMVTAYFARSCWISTMSSVLVGLVISEDLTSLHYKIHVLCNADVQEWIARDGDDVRQIALGDAAEIGFVDQIGCDNCGRPQHGCSRHAPIHKGYELVGILAVRDGGRIG